MSKVIALGELPTPNQILAELIGMQDDIAHIAVVIVRKDDCARMSYSTTPHDTLVYMARLLGKQVDEVAFGGGE